jgi:hypothetical protein
MSYIYTEFDGVSVPLFNHSQNHAPMAAESSFMDSVGGTFDWIGTARRKGRKQNISFTGVYLGQTEYLVDETGDPLIDDLSDYLIAGDSEDMLGNQVAALLEKKGVRASLWRKRLADDVLHWKTARLLQVNWPRKWDDHAIKADITCTFETSMEFWHAATATTTSGSATAGAPLGLTVDNAGQVVDDAIITITRTSGTITAVSLIGAELGINLAWAGSLGSGDVLTIDCGVQTVRKGSADAYSGLTLGGSHTARGWLPIASGPQSFVALVTGGNATVAITHYNQFP